MTVKRIAWRAHALRLYVWVAIVFCTVAAGCATAPQQNKDYAAYLAAAQSAATRPTDPIIRIKALPGQTVEFRGIELFEVYAPTSQTAASAIALPPKEEPHPAWGIASQVLGIVGAVLPGYYTGKWMNALAGTVSQGNASIANGAFTSLTDIAHQIQAPQPNITIGGDGVVGSGSFTGANSGRNSGNSGTIGKGNGDNRDNPVTTTNNTTTTDRNCSGAAAGGSC